MMFRNLFSILIIGLVISFVLVLHFFPINKDRNPMPSTRVVHIKDNVRAKENAETRPKSYAEKLFKLYDGVETFVMFIGYPRSSHSLVGAMLDAHPEIVIPHEYNLLAEWPKFQSANTTKKNMQKYLLFYELQQLSMRQALFGIRTNNNSTLKEYTYTYVPGLWQGGYQHRIKVIGDKRGGSTSMILFDQDSMEPLEKSTDLFNHHWKSSTLQGIHLIATMMLRNTGNRDTVRKRHRKFLNLNDLAHAAGTCFAWWSTIRRFRLMESREWEDLDLSESGTLYRFIPRRSFRYLTSLNLASTQVTNRHFIQIMRSSTSLEVLDISYCPGISQVAIFQAKDNLDYVQHISISGNRQLTILAVACLCSGPNIAAIEAHGLQLSAEELLFLKTTFKCVARGDVQLETDDGYHPLPITDTFYRELFDD